MDDIMSLLALIHFILFGFPLVICQSTGPPRNSHGNHLIYATP